MFSWSAFAVQDTTLLVGDHLWCWEHLCCTFELNRWIWIGYMELTHYIGLW